MPTNRSSIISMLRAGALAIGLLLGDAPVASAAGLQQGAPFRASGNTGGKLSWSFSGEFAAEPGEICLVPTEPVQILGGQTIRMTPPDGFNVSDLVIFFVPNVATTGPDGNVTFSDGPERIISVDDPPGAELRATELRFSTNETTFDYLYIAPERQIGPVVSNVPLVVNGADANGVPRIFVAEQDSATGRPIINNGPGHCFRPTATRANDPTTGEILPQYVFQGSTEVFGTLGDGASAPTTPEPETKPEANPPSGTRRGCACGVGPADEVGFGGVWLLALGVVGARRRRTGRTGRTG